MGRERGGGGKGKKHKEGRRNQTEEGPGQVEFAHSLSQSLSHKKLTTTYHQILTTTHYYKACLSRVGTVRAPACLGGQLSSI